MRLPSTDSSRFDAVFSDCEGVRAAQLPPLPAAAIRARA
jgi:hypothetical protein